MSIRDEDPIRPKVCPKCQQPAREADQRTEYVNGKPWYCETCDLFSSGTEAEFRRYRIEESVAAAERMTTSPKESRR